MKKLFVLFVLFLFVFGCTQTNTQVNGDEIADSDLVVANGDTIKVHYVGKLVSGDEFDSSVGKEPLSFTVGAHQVITGFENGVIGMKLNETKTITLLPVEAYGERKEDLIVEVPIEQFTSDVEWSVGMMVSSEGAGARCIISEIKDDVFVLDCNPPLAGETLIFKITVVEINKA